MSVTYKKITIIEISMELIAQANSIYNYLQFNCNSRLHPTKALFIWSGLAHPSGLPHLGGMFLSFRSYDIFYPTEVGWLPAENDLPFDVVSHFRSIAFTLAQ